MSSTPQTLPALPTQPSPDGPTPAGTQIPPEEYTKIRELSGRLFNLIFQDIVKTSLPDAAKTLGLARKGQIPKMPADIFAVLADFAIYDHYLGGQNAVQRYLKRLAPPTDAMEREVVECVAHPHYSLFTYVKRIEENVHHLFDVLAQSDRVFFDTAMGKSPMPPTAMLAARVLPIRGMWMTGGSIIGMPTGVLPALQQRLTNAGFEDLASGKPRPRKGEALAEAHALLIKSGLQLAAMSAAGRRVVR